jgi:predicted transcriptional regulator of viral defense system
MKMKYLEQLSEKRIFNHAFMLSITKSRTLADEIIQNYLKKGYIKRVKKNLYATTSIENGGVIPTKYEIASNITKSSFVSFNSAFAYYGYYNQVSNEITVSSLEQFRDFSFDYTYYHYKYTKNSKYVDEINGVRVSSLEKTIVDCIGDIKSYDDLEELMEVLSMLPMINGKKVFEYLKYVDKAILYSKVGLLLSFHKDDYNITNELLNEMKKHGIKKTRDFTNEKHRLKKYYKEWKLHCYDISRLNVEEIDEEL